MNKIISANHEAGNRAADGQQFDLITSNDTLTHDCQFAADLESHLLTCSLAHLLTFSLAHLLTCSLTHLLTCSLAHFLTCSLVQ